jgi:hypothetical protein
MSRRVKSPPGMCRTLSLWVAEFLPVSRRADVREGKNVVPVGHRPEDFISLVK